MIKLNNKNITYVALADSNNSLKAPKEIWYADSSNFVKLVYRRKDALIEGVDYEKYHWLRAEMPLNKLLMKLPVNSNNVDFYIKRLSLGNITILITNGYKYFFWNNAYQIGSFGNGADVEHHPYSSDTQLFHIVTNSTNVLINGIQFNSVGFPIRSINFITEPNGYEGVTLTSTISVDEIERYIPCKLLKPVPKWLDANGIRRQVGECGMIDLVSGKFYGNVSSVGTFTVENYYERKEWLVGDGSAYIDTDIIVDVPSLYISTSFTKKVNVEITSPLFGSRDTISSNGSQIFYQNGKLRFDIITNGVNWIIVDSSDIQNINQLIVDCPNKVININEITLSSGVDDLSVKNSSNTFKIYSLERLNESNGNSVPYNGSFGNFTLNDSTHSLNLIPCTLTMDLPASMDANNIARTKGTSGMWDLVSDRFYGNVASKGTFKAVNLAEGVDYEVHQWLVAEIPIGVSLMTLPINSDTLYYKKIWKTFGNSMYFETDGYAYFTPSNKKIEIYDRENNRTIYSSSSLINVDDVIEVNSSGNATLINNIELQQYNFPILDIRFFNANNATVTGISLTSSITVDGIERYIPVKLLKSIPSKYDANGIARQAGECGMYDTVNDVFYGNLTSSGTFTVEDDN